MKKHEIKIDGVGTKDELIKFLEMSITLLKTAKNLGKKDPDFETIDGSMSYNEETKFTIRTLN